MVVWLKTPTLKVEIHNSMDRNWLRMLKTPTLEVEIPSSRDRNWVSAFGGFRRVEIDTTWLPGRTPELEIGFEWSDGSKPHHPTHKSQFQGSKLGSIW